MRDGLPSTQHIALGFDVSKADAPVEIANGTHCLLAQEVRSPFAGTFSMTVQACGGGSSPELYEQMFLKHFTCRLVFFQYTDKAKRPTERSELATMTFTPKFCEGNTVAFESFNLTRQFLNATPGANFSFGLGLGVAVIVAKTSPDTLQLRAETADVSAFIRVGEVSLQFGGKERNEKVTV